MQMGDGQGAGAHIDEIGDDVGVAGGGGPVEGGLAVLVGVIDLQRRRQPAITAVAAAKATATEQQQQQR